MAFVDDDGSKKSVGYSRNKPVRPSSSATNARLKERIVRTVIKEVVADIDPEAAEIVLVVHWIGGVYTRCVCPDAAAVSATAPQPM